MLRSVSERRTVRLHPFTLTFSNAEYETRFRRTHNKDVLRQARCSLVLGAAIYLALGLEDLWFFPLDYPWVWGVRLAAAGMILAMLVLTWWPAVRRHLQTLMCTGAVLAGTGPLLMQLRGGPELLEAYAVGSLMIIVWAYTLSGMRFSVALIANGALLLCSVAVYWLWLEIEFYRTASVTLHLMMVGGLSGAAGYMIERQWRKLFMQAERLEAERKSHAHLALHDALTGLPNRHCMHVNLDEALSRARRSGQPFSLLFIDLNDFKPINDRFGHRVGDQVLIELASRLRETVREVDLVARLGGDEFVVLAEGATALHAARHLAPKILEVIGRGVAVMGITGPRIVRVTASIGIAGYPQHGTDAWQLLQNADLAMYRAKAVGGGIAAHDAMQPGPSPSVASEV